jgi:hypothetical protein
VLVLNNLIYTKRIVIYKAMFAAQQTQPNIPYVYKGVYFILVCRVFYCSLSIGQIFDIPGVNFK